MRKGARTELRALYHRHNYPAIDLVKREGGGRYGIKVFTRVYDTEVHVQVDKRRKPHPCLCTIVAEILTDRLFCACA